MTSRLKYLHLHSFQERPSKQSIPNKPHYIEYALDQASDEFVCWRHFSNCETHTALVYDMQIFNLNKGCHVLDFRELQGKIPSNIQKIRRHPCELLKSPISFTMHQTVIVISKKMGWFAKTRTWVGNCKGSPNGFASRVVSSHKSSKAVTEFLTNWFNL